MDKKIIKQTAYELFGVGAAPEHTAPAKGGRNEPVKPAVSAAPVVQPSAPAKPAASYLAPGTALEGQLRSEGDLEIAGSFRGSITTNGTVMLRSNIKSTVNAANLNLSGCSLEGDVTVTGTVTVSEDSRITGNTTLEEKARINGSVSTGTMSVARGAAICGSVEMGKKSGKKGDAAQA